MKLNFSKGGTNRVFNGKTSPSGTEYIEINNSYLDLTSNANETNYPQIKLEKNEKVRYIKTRRQYSSNVIYKRDQYVSSGKQFIGNLPSKIVSGTLTVRVNSSGGGALDWKINGMRGGGTSGSFNAPSGVSQIIFEVISGEKLWDITVDFNGYLEL